MDFFHIFPFKNPPYILSRSNLVSCLHIHIYCSKNMLHCLRILFVLLCCIVLRGCWEKMHKKVHPLHAVVLRMLWLCSTFTKDFIACGLAIVETACSTPNHTLHSPSVIAYQSYLSNNVCHIDRHDMLERKKHWQLFKSYHFFWSHVLAIYVCVPGLILSKCRCLYADFNYTL